MDGPPPVGAGEHLLVAVSGGPDSTALLLGLCTLARWRLTVAHVDHGLRATESRADAERVARLASRLGLPYVECRLRIAAGAGLEARARRARQQGLVKLAAEVGADRIVLGHTADDQAETLLLHLVRGAGRGGLAGMRRRRGRVLRPLLGATRADVSRFLADVGEPWSVDRSNAELRHARNRMRRLVVPLLAAEFNPNLVRGLATLADRLRDEDDVLRALAAARAGALERDGRLGAAVAGEPPALGRRIVRGWLEHGRRRGVSAAHVERVLALARSGGPARIAIPGAGTVRLERGALVREQGPAAERTRTWLRIAPGECVGDPGSGWRLRLSAPEPCPSGPVAATAGLPVFDAEALGAALVVRSRRPGDRVHLPGVGTRKLQDLLVDAKVPREARDRLPILEGDGEILWVPGVARGRGARVGSQTRLIVRGEILPAGRTG